MPVSSILLRMKWIFWLRTCFDSSIRGWVSYKTLLSLAFKKLNCFNNNKKLGYKYTNIPNFFCIHIMDIDTTDLSKSWVAPDTLIICVQVSQS